MFDTLLQFELHSLGAEKGCHVLKKVFFFQLKLIKAAKGLDLGAEPSFAEYLHPTHPTPIPPSLKSTRPPAENVNDSPDLLTCLPPPPPRRNYVAALMTFYNQLPDN